VAPPQLARDAPRLDVLEPVEPGLGPGLGHDLDIALLHRLECRKRELGRVDIPLVGQPRLDYHARTVAERCRDDAVLDANQRTFLLEQFDDSFARILAGEAEELAGNEAILRSTGQVASSSATSSTEAKDFKVVVALDNPPEEIRPGLSCTAKIVTATRHDVLSIPIQALTVRQKGELQDAAAAKKKLKDSGQAPLDLASEKQRKEEVTGIFVIANQKAEFRKVETGITGSTDIEVLSGVQPGEQIVIGSYQAIRTMRPGSRVKVDNRNAVIGAGG